MRPKRLVALCAVIGVAGLITVSKLGSDGATGEANGPVGLPTASGQPVTVTISPARSLGTWTATDLGLSFEYGDLTDGSLSPAGGLANLLGNLGPGVLRIGGNSVDDSPPGRPTDGDLSALAALLDQSGWKVIYSISLGHFDATLAAQEVQSAQQILGSHLLAFACGNEPTVFDQRNALRKAPYTQSQYLKQEGACLAVIRNQAPGVAITGPDTSNLGWAGAFLDHQRKDVSFISQHFYPFSACDSSDLGVGSLLSTKTADREAQKFAAAAHFAQSYGVGLRITETNSVGCGGVAGLSNSFAASLWTADVAFIAAENGAQGINLHQLLLDRTCGSYSPVCRENGGDYAPQAPYFGLIIDRLMGTGSLVETTAVKGVNLAAHAVVHDDGSASVLLVNRSKDRMAVTVYGPPALDHAGSVTLSSPDGISATTGMTIGGNTVDGADTFTAPATVGLRDANGTVAISVPPYSAVIVKFAANGAGASHL